jgi:hypothetical protein
VAALPDVHEACPSLAFAALGGGADDLDGLLEGVLVAGGVGGGGGGVADEAAEVDEVLVRRGTLRQLDPGPLLDEADDGCGIGGL